MGDRLLGLIPDPNGGTAPRDVVAATIARVSAQIRDWLAELRVLSREELLNQRYEKFRNMGLPLSSP